MTAPIRAIRYICYVRDAGSPELPMRLELALKLADTDLSFDKMAELGVRAVRGPRRLTRELATLVAEKLENQS